MLFDVNFREAFGEKRRVGIGLRSLRHGGFVGNGFGFGLGAFGWESPGLLFALGNEFVDEQVLLAEVVAFKFVVVGCALLFFFGKNLSVVGHGVKMSCSSA